MEQDFTGDRDGGKDERGLRRRLLPGDVVHEMALEGAAGVRFDSIVGILIGILVGGGSAVATD